MAEPIRVYADTSVFGGVFDAEFRVASQRFFDSVRQGRLQLVLSATVEDEVEGSPPQVRSLFREVFGLSEVVEPSEAALNLQLAYIRHGIVSAKRAADALHVATATAESCAAIVSWNFRHIVNSRRVPLYNAVNALHGYGSLVICTPLEVVGGDEEEV